ncbi:MAG: DUF998 domain-containing protein [Actinomycetota bacterium]|nr:DUF998 domain-containing protein [Actinomycetota bacterium]
MQFMPRWGLLTAAAAPILLVAGWTIAARLQTNGFDSTTQTISALAGADATDGWLMTTALAGVGVSQIGTALALKPAARAGRVVLGTGGVFTLLVAMSPLPTAGQAAPLHGVVAAGSFAALAAWPLLSWQRGASTPWALRPAVAMTAGSVLVVATGWFFASVVSDAPKVGLAERSAAVVLNLWPLAAAASIWRFQRRR